MGDRENVCQYGAVELAVTFIIQSGHSMSGRGAVCPPSKDCPVEVGELDSHKTHL